MENMLSFFTRQRRSSSTPTQLSIATTLTNNSQVTVFVVYPPLQTLPEEIVLGTVATFLTMPEVVRCLSATAKQYARLFRENYPISIEIFPFELIQGVGWRNMSMQALTSPWCRRGATYEEFVACLRKKSRFWSLSLQSTKNALQDLSGGQDMASMLNSTKNFHFDGLRATSPKKLNLEGIAMLHDDLLVLRQMETIESLSIEVFHFDGSLDSFPPKLRELSIKCSGNELMPVSGLPESLEVFKGVRVVVPTSNNEDDQELYFPEKLSRLSLAEAYGSDGREIVTLSFAFPPNLQTLEITSMSNLRFIPTQKLNNLEILEVGWCTALTMIPSIPPKLRRLRVDRCKRLHSLPLTKEAEDENESSRCDSLQELECNNCEALELDPYSLPPLKVLTICLCRKILDIPTILNQFSGSMEKIGLIDTLENFYDLSLPSGLFLKSLTLKKCPGISVLPTLPSSLKLLEVDTLKNLGDIMPLPEGLEILRFVSCDIIQPLDTIPPRLKEMELKGLRYFCVRDKVKFPPTLKILQIIGCPKFKVDFEKLPDQLERLDLGEFHDIVTIPYFPPNLRRIDLRYLHELTTLPPTLPDRLQEFGLYSCLQVRTFPPLPTRLRSLNLSYCSQIQFIGLDKVPGSGKVGIHGRFPSTLRILILRNCTGLERIGEFPGACSLSSVDFSGCSKDLPISTLPRHLQSLVF